MKTVDLAKLQNAEHLSYDQEVLKLLIEADQPALEPLRTQLATGTAQEDAAQKAIKKSSFTDQLTEKDRARDEIFRGLTLRVQSETYSVDANAKQAAKRLAIVLNTYGNLAAENLQKETTDIQSLLQELRGDKYLADANLCGVTQWAMWLQQANDDFYSLYTTRRDDQSAQPVFDMKAIRKSQDELMRKIWKKVDALMELQPTPAAEALAAKMDTTAEKWRNLLAQRRGTAMANTAISPRG